MCCFLHTGYQNKKHLSTSYLWWFPRQQDHSKCPWGRCSTRPFCNDLDFWPYCCAYPPTLHLHCHSSPFTHARGSSLWSCKHKWMYLYLRLLYLWWLCSQNPDHIRKWRDINSTLISWSSLFSGYFQPWN